MNIEAEAARIVATAKAEAEHFARFGRPVQPVPASVPAAQPVPPIPPIPEEHHMSVILDDADRAVTALAKHIKTIAGNPLVDTLVEAGAGLFLTPAEVIAVKAFVQSLEASRAPAAGVVQAGEAAVGAFQQGGAQQVRQTVSGAPAVV